MSVANVSARLGTDPTPGEMRALTAWRDALGANRTKAAALDLGMTESGVDSLLANVRARAGVRSTWEAVVRYLGPGR